VFVAVQPASAAVTTYCNDGIVGAVTVPGDLVVNRDKSCVLQGTTVVGNVKADGGSDLLLEGATVGGELIVVRNAYVDVIGGSSIAGQVRGRDAFGIFIEDSTVGGAIQQSNPNRTDFKPFVYLFSSGVAGGLTSTAGEVLIESSEVQGAVSSRNGEYTDIINSVLGSDLTVRNNVLGSVVCESEIYGNALFRGNQGTLQIGGGGEVGPCDGASFWGGDVTFTNNTAGETGFDISNNIVAGNLTGSGNDPLPTGSGNRVRGEITLEFAAEEEGMASIQDQSARSAEVQAEAEVVADTRVSELQTKVDQRRGQAVAAAESAPVGEALTTTP
jgi:hypothetical protein